MRELQNMHWSHLILSVLLASCGPSKGKNDSAANMGANVDEGGATRVISSGRLPITVKGIPSEYSRANNLDLTIESSIPFQMKITVASGPQCESPSGDTPWLESPKIFQVRPIGADGVYSLCISMVGVDTNSSNTVVDFKSVSWLKDTAVPMIRTTIGQVYGPGSGSTENIVFSGQALDSGAGLSNVVYKLRRKIDGACFDATVAKFQTSCSFSSVTGRDNWTISVPKSAFTVDGEHYVSIQANDRAGNVSSELTSTFTWDRTPPGGVNNLVVRSDHSGLNLSWSAPAGNDDVLVIRSLNGSPSFVPESGKRYQRGEYLGEGLLVVHAGSGSKFLDSQVEAYKAYYYAVFFTDAAFNYSVPMMADQVFMPPNTFFGIGRAFLTDPNFNLLLSWRPFKSQSGGTTGGVGYNVFANRSSDQLFSANPILHVSKADSVITKWPSEIKSDQVIFGSRALTSEGFSDGNRAMIPMNIGPGYFHRLVGGGRLNGHDPLAIQVSTPRALALSTNGNIVFTSSAGVVSAICNENINDAFCAGRELGLVYSIVGRDGYGDAVNGEPAEHAPLGEIRDIAFDRVGNLVLADAKYSRIRVVCYDVTRAGACYLKTPGFVYNLVGIGSSADGGSGGDLGVTGIGRPSALFVDSDNNIVFGDATFYRLRVACFSANGPICGANRQSGKLYNIAGSGDFRDSSEGTSPDISSFGNITAIEVDSDGNIIFADNSFYRVRALCRVAKVGGLCQGRTIGKVHTVAGTGRAGDTPDGGSAGSSSIGEALDVRSDGSGNFYLTDGSFYRIRLLCFNAAEGSQCSGRSPGAIYNLYGTGSPNNPEDGDTIRNASFGRPVNISFDEARNLVVLDGSYRVVRTLCLGDTGVCSGRKAGSIYRYAGSISLLPILDGSHGFSTVPGIVNAVATDKWGNVYWSDLRRYQIFTLCSEVIGGGFCLGKEPGRVYRVAGNGRYEDGLDSTLATSAGLGQVDAISIDKFGNIYFGDSSFFRVRVICIDTSASVVGFCSNKSPMLSYRAVGSTAGAKFDSESNVLAQVSGIGFPSSMTVDHDGNLFFGDGDYFRIRIVCFNVAAAGYCNTRNFGYMFRYAGRGGSAGSGDGSDGGVASNTPHGKIRGLAVDSFGNVYAGDETYYKVRVICAQASGNCAGKTVGNVYWFAGNGAKGDAQNGAPISGPMGAPFGLALDSGDNILIADGSYNRVRLLCKNQAGACSGFLPDAAYRLAGNGLVDVPVSNATAPYLSLERMGNACLAIGPHDSVILGSIDGGVAMITSGVLPNH